MRAAVAVLAVLVALAACKKREQAPPPAARAPAPAPAAGPLTYEKKTTAAEVALKLPERVGQLPALYARLFAEGRNALDAFAEGATGEIEELRAAGLPAAPYAREIEYTVAAETPRLLSLAVSNYENTGGAHPNASLDALTWDKATGRALPLVELFRPGADMAAANKALCDAIRTAKTERTGEASFAGELNACPALATVKATLAPSTVAGKAGGLTVLFSPYEIGPYVEGAYEIDLPLASFRSVLAPAYAGEFDGAPAPQPAAKAG